MAKAKKDKMIDVIAVRKGFMANRIVLPGTKFKCPENKLGSWMVRKDRKPIARPSKKIASYGDLRGENPAVIAAIQALQGQLDAANRENAQLKADGLAHIHAADEADKLERQEPEFTDTPPAAEEDELQETGQASADELADAEAQANEEAADQGTDAL